MRRDVAAAEGEPERELPPQPPLRARQVLELGEGAAELGEGLRERRAGEGAAPGPFVVVDRLLASPAWPKWCASSSGSVSAVSGSAPRGPGQCGRGAAGDG